MPRSTPATGSSRSRVTSPAVTLPEFALVWRFRSPHHFRGKSEMRTSEPKPHEVNELIVSFDSEVRKGGIKRSSQRACWPIGEVRQVPLRAFSI